MSARAKFSLLPLISLITLISLTRPIPATAATLSLSPATGNYSYKTSFPVAIVLDTQGQNVVGATAILEYDPGALIVLDDVPTTPGIQIQKGSVFNANPFTNLVTTSSGQIRFDVGSLGTTFKGKGTLATIHFQTAISGPTEVKFVFDPAVTLDTSLVASANTPDNLLQSVGNGSYAVIGGPTKSPKPAPQPPEPTPVPEPPPPANPVIAFFQTVNPIPRLQALLSALLFNR